MSDIEQVADASGILALVIRAGATSDATAFLTSSDSAFQAGFVVYPANGRVKPHVHLPVARHIEGTAEFLLVRSGRCVVDIYSADRRIVATRELGPGDAVLSLGGGHGFRMLADTVLLEIKQGPYNLAEKERFEDEGGPE